MSLEKLVSELSEIDHPVFGHPELANAARRDSEDRLERVVQVYKALADLLGKPLKVLDLGCALGYFSFNLAQLGADVTAIDSDPICVGVCREILRENPHLSVSVMQMSVENNLDALQSGGFDLVLGMSIFHHIAFSAGFKSAYAIVQELIGENSVLLCELAEKTEPVYWAQSLPERPLDFLEPASFVVEIDRFENHLSSKTRGLWVASNATWVLGSRAGFFDRVTDQSHPFVGNFHRGTRKYFFGANTIVKKYSLGSELDEHNLKEAEREVENLTTAPPELGFPQLLFGGKLGDSYWIAESRLDGLPLLDGRRFRSEVQPRQLIQRLLDELVALEKAGLYHSDIRSWNILISTEGKVRIIDFGSVQPKTTQDYSPAFAIFDFMAFALEVLKGTPFGRAVNPASVLNPDSFPQDMRPWAAQILEHDAGSLSFRQISNWFQESSCLNPKRGIVDRSWLNLSEELVQSLISEVSWLREGELVGSVEALSSEVLGLRERAVHLEEELGRVHAANHYHFVEGEGLKARLAEVEQTLSWKLTRPLRGVANALRSSRARFITVAKKIVFSARVHRLAVKVPWLATVTKKTLGVVSGWPVVGGFALRLRALLSESKAMHYRGLSDHQSDAMSIRALEILEILSSPKTTGLAAK